MAQRLAVSTDTHTLRSQRRPRGRAFRFERIVTPPAPPPRLSRAARCFTQRPPLVPHAILSPPGPVPPSSTLVHLSTARLLATADRPPSCAAAKALVERGVIPPLGGPARLLVPTHDVGADRRQRRTWRGAARATVRDTTAAFFASDAAGAMLPGGAGGAHVHGGAGGLAGVPLWVSSRDGGSHSHGGSHSIWAERAREAPARPPLAAPAALPVCITLRHAASLAFQHRVFINFFFCIFVAPLLRLLWMHN